MATTTQEKTTFGDRTLREAGAGAQAPALRAASLRERLGARYGINPEAVMRILKATAFKIKNGEASDEQMAALMAVADQYGLNPFTREIFAFPDKQNGIVPVVGVDGWSRIINDQDELDGIEFTYADEFVKIDDDAKSAPEWCDCTIYRKDRDKPITVREYLDEVYRPVGHYSDGNKMSPGAWQTHTKRLLRHKTLIQCARVAFGFSGIYDEDEAQRIIDVTPTNVPDEPTTKKGGVEGLKQAMSGKPERESAGEESTEAPEITLRDYIGKLNDMDDPDTMADQINEFPEEIRNDKLFTKAFAARLKEIKDKKGQKKKGKGAPRPTLEEQARSIVEQMNKIEDIEELAGWFGDNVPPELADDEELQKVYRERLDAIAEKMERERTDK